MAVVLLGHGLAGTWIRTAGAVGVTLFFVLSGFLITRLLLEERWRTSGIGLRAFYWRRARRLLPALPGALAFCLVANWILDDKPLAAPVVAALTYTSNFASTVESHGAFNHLWSLAVEEHFYLVWPVLMAGVRLRLLPVVAVVGLIASAGGRIGWASQDAYAYQWTHFRLDALLVGALLAFLIARVRRPGPLSLVAATGVLSAFLPAAMFSVLADWGVTAVAAACVVLVVAAVGDVRERPRLERLGRISYGVYLFHYPVMKVAQERFLLPWWLTLAVTVAGGVGLAEMSWRLIEHRALRRPDALAREQSAGDEVRATEGQELDAFDRAAAPPVAPPRVVTMTEPRTPRSP